MNLRCKLFKFASLDESYLPIAKNPTFEPGVRVCGVCAGGVCVGGVCAGGVCVGGVCAGTVLNSCYFLAAIKPYSLFTAYIASHVDKVKAYLFGMQQLRLNSCRLRRWRLRRWRLNLTWAKKKERERERDIYIYIVVYMCVFDRTRGCIHINQTLPLCKVQGSEFRVRYTI